MAISNTLEYCLKYGGIFVSAVKALQTGCSVIKVSGGLSVFYMGVGSTYLLKQNTIFLMISIITTIILIQCIQ